MQGSGFVNLFLLQRRRKIGRILFESFPKGLDKEKKM